MDEKWKNIHPKMRHSPCTVNQHGGRFEKNAILNFFMIFVLVFAFLLNGCIARLVVCKVRADSTFCCSYSHYSMTVCPLFRRLVSGNRCCAPLLVLVRSKRVRPFCAERKVNKIFS